MRACQRSLDPTSSWPTQDSTIAQLTQRIIFEKLMQSISTTYIPQRFTPKVTEQSRVLIGYASLALASNSSCGSSVAPSC